MTNIADMSGTSGWGPVSPPDPDERPFAEPWERRAFAMTAFTMGRISGQNLDAFRYALARLDRSAYLDDGYYGRWLNAAELMLIESAILAPGAVDARARRNAGEDVVEPPAPEPARPDYAATAPGSLRRIDTPPAFVEGERVRALAVPPPGAGKLPGYVAGHPGVVDLVQPAHVLPDTHAVFRGENPQYVYTVRFASRELWGAASEEFSVTVELFESYLEKA
ncbi:MAG: nitrile hydratase subunit beta [Pseudonocardia sp.]|nr:nitrile hydratase subunit beta [Pseudonocardia sp.]